MTKKELAIASYCNTAWAPHLAALILSIIDNCQKKDILFHFFVLDIQLTDTDRQMLKTIVSIKREKASIEFLTIDNHLVRRTDQELSKVANARILLPALLKNQSTEKILYLDCDMIALEDISELWAVDFSGHVIAAVEDASFHHPSIEVDLPIKTLLYFNSGAIVIDVLKWNQLGITKKVLEYIKRYPNKLECHDQEALNVVLYNQWYRLHPKWNVQSYILNKTKRHPTFIGEKEYREARKRPYIIHYSGQPKPWQPAFQHPSKNYYELYTTQVKSLLRLLENLVG